MTAELNFKTPAQIEHVRKLFDRGADYGALVEADRRGEEPRCSDLENARPDTLVQRLRRSFDELVAIDFYPGQAQLQAKEALAGLERETQRLHSEGEPRSAAGTSAPARSGEVSQSHLGDAKESVGGPPRERLAHQALHRQQREIRVDRAAARSAAGAPSGSISTAPSSRTSATG